LIPAVTRLNPYAATFSSGEPDSVGESRVELRDWWRRLTAWHGPDRLQPRSFTDLVRQNPTTPVVAVLSAAYIRACLDDLRAADDVPGGDRDRVTVIGPASCQADVDELLVPVTARLRSIVGGSLQALHARVAAHLLTAATAQSGTISRARLREAALEAAAAAPPDPSRRTPGTRMTDDEVRDLVRQELATGPASATTLLRLMRQSGRSCEQSRFKRLYADAVAAAVRA
jgi:hypothetical protein